jgi:YD repeat-containing protein
MKRILLSINMLFICFCIKAQELPTYTAHSPNVAALGQFNNYPVDFSTGVPKIEIPLYTIKGSKLELPISLSYHASGIKQEQEASSVGLGWVLNAGGFISRSIQDSPDEHPYGFLNSGNVLPDYNSIDNNDPVGMVGNNDSLKGYFKYTDKEPDLFNINTTNLSGQFCLNNMLKFVSTNYEPLDYTVDLINNLIIIKDENGNIYRFGKNINNEDAFETSVLSSSTMSLNSSTNYNPPKPVSPTHTSSWYLTEIISADRTDTISFKYKSYYFSDTKVSAYTRFVLQAGGPLSNTDAIGVEFDGLNRSYLTTVIPNIRVLDKILFKNGSIEFSTNNDRLDINSGVDPTRTPRITGLTIYDKDRHQIKKVVFDNNDYFNRLGETGLDYMPVSGERKKSLKLNAVKFYGNNNVFLNDYKFQYDPTPLASRNTGAQDYWGYCNGKTNATLIPESIILDSFSGKPVSLGESRKSDYNYMKAAILNKITYPTGGYSIYDYEPNYYLNQKQSQSKTQKNKTEGIFAINRLNTCDPDYFNGIPANNTREFDVVEDVNTSTIGKLYIMFSDYKYPNGQSMTFRLTNLNNGELHYFEHITSEKDQVKVFNKDIVIRQGNRYRLEAMTNGVTGSNSSMCDSPYIQAGLSYDYWETATTQDIIPEQAGGLRIKTISSFDADNSPVTKKMYKYGDKEFGQNKIGVGTLITDPTKNFYNYPLLYATLPSLKVLKNVLWFTSNSQIELGLNNGNPVDYDKVIELTVSYNNTNISNGKTEYYYTTSGRDVIPNSYVYRPYDQFVFPSWKKSSLSKMIHYKQLNNLAYLPVSSEENTLTDLPERRIKTLKIIEQEPDIYLEDTNYTLINNPNRFRYYNSYVSTGKKVNTAKIVKEYENGLVTMTTTTNYSYNNLEHLQVTSTETTSSNGETLSTKNYYPDDKNILAGLSLQSKSALDGLKGQHRIAEQIQVETYKNNELLSTKRTNFKDWGINAANDGNLISPETILTSKGTNTLEDRVKFNLLDNSNGNPLELQMVNGATIVYIWGYNKTQPIAKIENATYAQVQPYESNLHTVSDTGTEAALLTALTSLRTSLPNAMVTTYTHIPLVGVSTITDPKGDTITYTYDSFGRLQNVKDKNGNILSENEYHYKN